MILELGQISLARAGGIRPGRYQGRGRGRPRWTPAEIRPGSPDPGVPRTQVQSQRSNNYDFRVGQNFPGTCRWNPARPVPGAGPGPPPRPRCRPPNPPRGVGERYASYWPRPWSDFGVPVGAGRLPK